MHKYSVCVYPHPLVIILCVFLLTLYQFIFRPRFNPSGTLLAVGSDDACVDIYSISTPSSPSPSPSPSLARVGYCRGIPSFVTHIDWSVDGGHLQVGADVLCYLPFSAQRPLVHLACKYINGHPTWEVTAAFACGVFLAWFSSHSCKCTGVCVYKV